VLDAALGLAARGFKVFPIKAGTKAQPLIAEWPARATTDENQIRQWWLAWPNANPGVHCNGLLVVDVDPTKGGWESLAALEKEIELEATYEVETPRGGRHIYYRCADAVRNGVDVLGPGVDIRTLGGYVVGAGSRTVEDARTRTAAGEYRVVADEPIAGADVALVARVRARSVPDRGSVPEAVGTDEAGAVARAVDFLRTHPVAVQGAGGDHHTFRTICRVRDFGVPQERAREALEDWNARCVPPWEAEELEVKIHNAYRYAQDAPGKLTPEAMGFEDVSALNSGTTPPIVKLEVNGLLHPANVDEADILRIAYHIKGVLEYQSDAVLFGTWNVGKTFVVLDMAASIACGLPWFGRRVKQGRVLYVGYEGIRALRKRMWALREKYPMLKDTRTPFRYHAMTDPLTIKSGTDEMTVVLKDFIALHGGPPDIIVIDTLAAALGGDDSDANKMAELNRYIKALIRKKYTILRVHHTGHSNQDRARGHSMLPAGIDTEIRVDKQEIALTKQRDDVRSKAYYKLVVVEVGRDTDGDPVTTCVVEQIEDNPLSPELTTPQREVMDRVIARCGINGLATLTEVRDSMPEDMSSTQRRALLEVLDRKQYLRPEGGGYRVCERGPAAMFDGGSNEDHRGAAQS